MDHAKIVKGRMVSVGEENLLAVIVMINVSLKVRAANSSIIENCFLPRHCLFIRFYCFLGFSVQNF